MYPKWNLSRRKHRLKTALAWWFNFDPQPFFSLPPTNIAPVGGTPFLLGLSFWGYPVSVAMLVGGRVHFRKRQEARLFESRHPGVLCPAQGFILNSLAYHIGSSAHVRVSSSKRPLIEDGDSGCFFSRSCAPCSVVGPDLATASLASWILGPLGPVWQADLTPPDCVSAMISAANAQAAQRRVTSSGVLSVRRWCAHF